LENCDCKTAIGKQNLWARLKTIKRKECNAKLSNEKKKDEPTTPTPTERWLYDNRIAGPLNLAWLCGYAVKFAGTNAA
jgi:hypothetical protein